MPGALADGAHMAGTFARAGVLRPSRPDRVLRALVGLHRWGPTLAAGYLGAAARFPAAPAVQDDAGEISFSDLEEHSNALARALAGYGVRSGDGVAILCRNHRWFVEASVACAKLGANALYLNTSFAGPQIAQVVGRERPAAVIYDEEFGPLLTEARAGRPSFIAWSEGGSADPTLQELIAIRDPGPLPPPEQAGRAVILTSGTTGAPKGANRPSPSSLAPAASLLAAIPLRARESTMIAAPLFHSWGYAHMFLSTALASTLVLRRRFDPADTLRAVSSSGATALIVVPVMLQRMLELAPEAIAEFDVFGLRVIAASGSALPGPLALRVMDTFGDKLYNLYGSTEVAWASIASPQDLRAAPGTAGRPPRGTVVKILGDEDRELPAGDTGRIFVGSELLFDGYTSGTDKDRIGALMATGDVGHFDDAGRLFVDGRDDDMIVSGGENVFPGEIEDLLLHAPGVVDAAVIGVPDEEFGQRLLAFVVLAPGASPTEAELKEHVRAHSARFKVPREIRFVEELPRNATGKILKRDLAH